MSYPVVDQTTPIETIIALAQMGGRFKFRCLACGKMHCLDSKAWKRCSKNYHYSLRTTIRGTVAEVSITSELGFGTRITLPGLVIRLPQIYSHKLALYDKEQAATLLLEYTRIHNELSSIYRPQLIVSDDIFIPLHIIVGWEKLRQFAYDYGVLPEDSPFQQYRRAVLKCIEKCGAFVREYAELFTPYMPIPIKIIRDASSQHLSVIRDDGKVLDFNQIYNKCKEQVENKYQLEDLLCEIVHPVVDFIHIYKQPPFVIIKGFEYITLNDFSYSVEPLSSSPPSLKCYFDILRASLLYADPTNPLNREDPITAYVLKTIEELQFLFKSSIKEPV
jgi:hypothetical protein